jgi:hypothetical protein
LDALEDFALGGWGEVTVFNCAGEEEIRID